MSRSVLFIAGPIGAGKSTLARELLRFVPDSSSSTFSRGLRRLGASEGVPLTSREHLQEYGERIARTRWLELWEATVASAEFPHAPNLLIDGLRHVHILKQLRHLPDVSVHLLTLWPTHDEVVLRRAHRGDVNLNEGHVVESQLPELAGESDLLLHGRVANDARAEHLAHLLTPIWTAS